MTESVEEFHARQVRLNVARGLPPTITDERVLGLLAAVLAAHAAERTDEAAERTDER